MTMQLRYSIFVALNLLVALSCRRRGFCPSCGARRMVDLAAHLVDRVLPDVPVRQWVLSLPFGLRYLVAHNADDIVAVAEADPHLYCGR